MNVKKKGNRGERELLHLLEAHGVAACRNDQRYIGGEGRPDIEAVVNGADLHLEVKRTERLRLSEALQQAEHDAAGRVPVVAFRASRQPWRVVLRLEDFLQLTKEAEFDDEH